MHLIQKIRKYLENCQTLKLIEQDLMDTVGKFLKRFQPWIGVLFNELITIQAIIPHSQMARLHAYLI